MDIITIFIKKFADLQLNYTKKAKQLNPMKSIAINDKLAEIFYEIFLINIVTNQSIQNCIISTTKIENFDATLNDLKVKTIKNYNKINKYIFPNKKKASLLNTKFFHLNFKICQILIPSLIKLTNKNKNNSEQIIKVFN